MNLAIKDIRFNLLRFILTSVGVGLLITASIGMIGLYRGIVHDALLVIDRIGADYWIVQGGRAGPFAEGSSIATDMDRRVEGLPGVALTRRFVQSSDQVRVDDRDVRITLTALDFPKDKGDWINLVQGRLLTNARSEAIADESLGLEVGDTIRLGQDDLTVVGMTRGMVGQMGDGILFVSVNDALAIGRRRTSEEVLLARARKPDTTSEGFDGSSVAQQSPISAVLVSMKPNADETLLRRAVASWGDANILSAADQRDLLLNQRLWRLRIQILAFTAVLLVVMAIVISLIIYTMTLEKLHQIALLKLIGARDSVVIGMIVQQAVLIGVIGFIFGVAIAQAIFPNFPRNVIIDPDDLAIVFGAVIVTSGLGSQIGISKAKRVRAQEVLS